MLLTILSSLSQEESRSISENVLWGVRKKMSDGKFNMCYSAFLGYDRGENGEPVINEEQAVIVRKIYRLYLEGLSGYAIANRLTEENILTPRGNKEWSPSTVMSILRNEKYIGDAKLQKTYTESFLTHKTLPNDGRLPQYYVENSHPAIISKAVYELVQQEIRHRKNFNGRYSGNDILASRVICGECECFYGAKIWHSNDKYRRVIYRCNHKYNKGDRRATCGTPHLTESEIKNCFIKAVNEIIGSKCEIINNLETVRKLLCNNTGLEQECSTLQEELNVLVKMIQNCVAENTRTVQNQEEYRKRYEGLVQKYEFVKSQLEEKEQLVSANITKSMAFEVFIKALKNQENLLTDFDEGLWGSLLESITVYAKEKIVVRFRNGTEIVTTK